MVVSHAHGARDYLPRQPDSTRSIGCAVPGGAPAEMLRNRAPWLSIADPAAQRRAALSFDRGIDGGKKILGVRIHVAVDKYGIPLAIASPRT
jgi:hypothetical protein